MFHQLEFFVEGDDATVFLPEHGDAYGLVVFRHQRVAYGAGRIHGSQKCSQAIGAMQFLLAVIWKGFSLRVWLVAA
ncbi:hypothetical protein M002_22045 [Pseudomonas aeruginosa ID4365]|nr:hypothetical protein M002_22045 [Pseudomonas aeruginosa ID4365]